MSDELEELEELSLTDDKDEPSSVLTLANSMRKKQEQDDDDNEESESDSDEDSDTEDDKKDANSDEEESEGSESADSDDDESEENVATTRPSTLFPGLEISDDEEADDEDEDYLQKFDENLNSDILSQYYPELQAHNYDEVDAMTRVVRDESGIIIDPFHKTLPFITKYEKARILGERAKQLNSGARPMVEVDENLIDGYLIALKEYDEKKIPFIIKRPLPNGSCEYWRFSDMEFLA
jgi:DNA-directed RNA polymerase I, II, and III subunit RPABC2